MTTIINSVTSRELEAIMQHDSSALIVDVRSDEEYMNLHIPGSVSIPLQQLSVHRINRVPGYAAGRLQALYLVCGSGSHAEQAYRRLETMGLNNIHTLQGGMTTWIASRLSVITQHQTPSLKALAFIFTVFLFLVLTLKGLVLGPWFFLLAAVIGVGLILSSHSSNNMLSVGICRVPLTDDMRR